MKFGRAEGNRAVGRTVRVGAVGLTVALAAAACGGSSGSKGTSSTSSGKPAAGGKGGTLSILENADFEHLDPARNYVSQSLDFSRVFIRTLTTYKAQPGQAGNEVVGDLATNTGTPSNGAKTWTFKLKDGLKYEDGTPITAQDIKYGVERTFSDQLPEGPAYQRLWLNCKGYKGPYKDTKGCNAISTPDAKTIVFNLNRPVGDFPYLVAFPLFSPIPKAKDTSTNYDNRPFASGPYKIGSYQRGKQLTLVRNKYWDAKTDTVRKALPDSIKVIMGLDPAVIDQRLIASSGEDANGVDLDTSIDPSNLAKVQSSPQIKTRSIGGITGFERYLWINTKKKPFDNLKVRQALQYLVNKQTYRTARGGPIAGGDFASEIIAPTVPGHKNYNLFPAAPAGDVAKAKALLTSAGFPNGFKTELITTNAGKGVTQATAVQEALSRGGIKADITQVDQAVYYTQIGDIKKQPALGFAAWGPDWPSASTVIPPLFDGRQIQPTGNQNFSQYNNPAVNKKIDEISAMTDKKAADAAWGDLDETIMKDAPWVPLVFERAINLAGSNVKNNYRHAFYGLPDIAAMSVK